MIIKIIPSGWGARLDMIFLNFLMSFFFFNYFSFLKNTMPWGNSKDGTIKMYFNQQQVIFEIFKSYFLLVKYLSTLTAFGSSLIMICSRGSSVSLGSCSLSTSERIGRRLWFSCVWIMNFLRKRFTTPDERGRCEWYPKGRICKVTMQFSFFITLQIIFHSAFASGLKISTHSRLHLLLKLYEGGGARSSSVNSWTFPSVNTFSWDFLAYYFSPASAVSFSLPLSWDYWPCCCSKFYYEAYCYDYYWLSVYFWLFAFSAIRFCCSLYCSLCLFPFSLFLRALSV